MTPTIPKSRPQKTWAQIKAVIEEHGVAPKGLILVFYRGYYRDSIGKVGVNDRNEYDDAAFVWCDVPGKMRSYNANTDPSKYRPGFGTGKNKGMATLAPGVGAFVRGLHKGLYRALRQYGTFKIIRDGKPDYIEYDSDSGINGHRGGVYTTSSEGCLTIPPNQYDGDSSDFLETIDAYAAHYGLKDDDPIIWILVERQG